MKPVAQLLDAFRRLRESRDPAAAADQALVDLVREAAVALEEAELSHDEIRRNLSAAVKATKPTGNGYYCWIRDVFDDHLVYEEETPTGTTLYQQGYSIDDAGKVTLATDVVKVRQATSYVEVAESTGVRESGSDAAELEEAELTSEVVPLVEKAVRKDGSFPIRIIAPGWGSSGYYSESVLKRDIPKVFPKGTHMHFDHPTVTESKERPERSVKTIAAVTTSLPVWQEKGPAGPGMYAEAKARTPFQADIEELAPHIGVSIVATGHRKNGVAEGKKGPVIESIDQGGSIDFVTQAGAGGQVISLFEAARGRAVSEPIEEGDDVSEQELKEAREAATAAKAAETAALAENARLREGAILREARDIAGEVLAKVTDLPEITRTRLLEQVSRDPSAHIKDGALDRAAFEASISEAVKAEAKYLADLTGSGRVIGMGGAGSGSEAGVKESEDRLAAALGRGFGLNAAETKQAVAGRSH
jgi:hypothetical protein